MELREYQEQLALIKAWLGNGSINIFGLPFAGKDTHAQTLADALDGIVLGGGDILRNSDIPEHVRTLIDAGNLAPTDDYINIVLPYLSREEFRDHPLILSSVGRWHGEEEGVIGAAKASGHELKAVIYLDIDEDIARQRWEASREDETRGPRADDARHKLDTRFDEFKNKTLPVVDYYREAGLLIEIDGKPDTARVSQDIIDALLAFSKL
jgi:adenylate kinase